MTLPYLFRLPKCNIDNAMPMPLRQHVTSGKYAGSSTPPTSIKERETHWSKVPYAKPPLETGKQEVRLENPTQTSTQQEQG